MWTLPQIVKIQNGTKVQHNTQVPVGKHNNRQHASPHHEVATDVKQMPIRPIIIIIILLLYKPIHCGELHATDIGKSTGSRSSTGENSGGPMKSLIVLILLSVKKNLMYGATLWGF